MKVLGVLAGYAAAIVLAWIAVAMRFHYTSGAIRDASSGMYAFGDLILFLAVFTVLSLAPTATALYFLRSRPIFWTVLSTLALFLAATGLAALAGYACCRTESWAAATPLRILAAPLLMLVFLLSAVVAPRRGPRLAFLAAAAAEAAVSAYAGFVWFR